MSRKKLTMPTSDQVDKVMTLLARGGQGAALRNACRKQGIPEALTEEAITRGRQMLAACADTAHQEETGAAITRLRDIYLRAHTLSADGQAEDFARIGAWNTALASQRELSKLLNLYRTEQSEGEGADLASQMEQALAHLQPLGLTKRPDASLVELCRLAALRITNAKGRR